MTKKPSALSRQAPPPVSGGQRKLLPGSPPRNRFVTLARLLTGTDRLARLLPLLHEHAVAATRGSCSLLLQCESRTTRLRATSCFGLEQLPTDAWPRSAAEHRLLELTLKEGRPLLFGGSQLPDLKSLLGTEPMIVAPLLQWQEPVGVLAIGAPEGPLSIETAEELEGVTHAFVLALHHARGNRHAELQRELRALLQGFSRTVSSSLNLTSSLETFCEGANRLFAADRTSVWLHDRHAREMVLEASSDESYRARGGRVSTEDLLAPAAAALRRDRAEIVETLPHDDDALVGIVTVPLRGRRRALGTLVFESVRVETGTELELLDRIDETGRQLAAAIENVQLLEGVLRSHRELENTFNSIRDLVGVSDRHGRIVRANLALAERLGTTRDELVDRPITEVLGPATARLAAGIELESDGTDGIGITEELQDPVLNGTFSVMVSRLLGESHEPLGHVLVAREVTPRARLEAEHEQLRTRLTQSEKLAALGQLVAGIAHELNNPLQGVLGHLELLRGTRTLPRSLQRDVRVVYREADRAAKIIRNLLVFAGSRKLMRQPLSVNQVLSRIITLRAPACRAAHIEIVRHFETLPRVHGDPVLLQQALFNVITNAEQALDATRGGRIEIGTVVEPSMGMIVATIRDTGHGIASQVLPRIFEPFYTTKEVGKGIGLGLAIAYGIIQEHGGEIIATNHPEGGALFRIALPVATQQRTRAHDEPRGGWSPTTQERNSGP